MKFSDLMLDMATGDASVHDAYIQESVGKINVSNAIFDVAYKISELPAGEFMCVQEAADAGLPTDPSEAASLCSEAVKQGLVALYDLTIQTAKKIKQSTEKSMKAIIAIGKKYGIDAPSGNDIDKFASAVSKAIISDKSDNGKKIVLADKQFINGARAIGMGDDYTLAMVNILSGYGVRLNVGDITARRNIETLKDLYKNMSTGVKIVDYNKTANKGSFYVNTVKEADIYDFIIGLYELIACSKAVIEQAGSASVKKTSTDLITSLCENDKRNEKKVSRTVQSIMEDVKTGSENLTHFVDTAVKAFTDSTYVLSNIVNGTPVE